MVEVTDEVLAKARAHVMSAAEKFEQRVSFVYGQQDFDGPSRSKEEVRVHVADMTGYPLAEMAELESLRTENARLNQEVERWIKAHEIAFNQAVANGESAARLRRERDALRKAVSNILGGEKSASGTWGDMVEPLVARFDVAANFGGDAVHNAYGSAAIAELLRQMSQRLDRSVEAACQALASITEEQKSG